MRRQWIAVTTAVVLSLCTITVRADIGLDWLAAQSRSDGRVVTDGGIATPLQATGEALQALVAAGEGGAAAAVAARSYVAADPADGVEALARKVIAVSSGGGETSTLLASLLGSRRPGGGFGPPTGGDGTALDTAWALRALLAAGAGRSAPAGAAADFLIAGQSGGGWRGTDAAPSPYVTALAAAVLPQMPARPDAAAAAAGARAWLLSRRGGDALWGEDYLSAVTLLALIQTPDDAAALSGSIAALRARQRGDGSWGGDVYATSLAEQVLAQAADPPASKRLGAVTGQVVDGASGRGLAGAAVTLAGPDSRTAAADAAGAFLISGLQPGVYRLSLDATGYAGLATQTTVAAGGRRDVGTVRLVPAPGAASGTILGTLTGAVDGRPLAGARIEVSGGASAVTDAQGDYLIAGVPAGTVTVTAALTGYSIAAAAIEVPAGGSSVFSAALTRVAAVTTAVTGVVTDAAEGRPLAGVAVSITGDAAGAAVTAADGTYRIAGLAAGASELTAVLPGYDTAGIPLNLATGTVLHVSPRLYAAGTSPADSNTQALRGVVIDAATARPVGGAVVTAAYGGASAAVVTAADGGFLITGIDATSAALQVTAPGYAPRTLALVLAPLATLDLGRTALRPAAAAELLPDLAVTAIDGTAAAGDAQTLAVSGALTATIANRGTAPTSLSADVTAFYDADKDGRLTAGVDTVLGTAAAGAVAAGGTVDVTVHLDGRLPYRDAPVTVAVDTEQAVPEQDEDDNHRKVSPACSGGGAPPGITAAPGYTVTVYADHVTTQSGPTALALDSHGRLYFTGGDTGAAFTLPPDGGAAVPFGAMQVADSDGLAIDAGDDVIVAGVPVVKFAPDQSVLWSDECPAGNIQSAAVDRAGNVYVGSLGSAICKISPDGGSIELLGGFNAPSNPAVGPDGALYVAEYGSRDIVRADAATGARLGVVTSGLLATQLAFTPDGTLLAGDFTAGSLVAIDPADGTRSTLVSGFPQPQALTVSTDGAGDMYVGDQLNKTVYKVSRLGSAADLTAGMLEVLDDGAGAGLSLRLRVGNAGDGAAAAGVPVAFYDGDPAGGGRVLGRVALPALAGDSWREARLDGIPLLSGGPVYAVVDPDGAVAQCRRDNDTVHAAVPLGRRAAIAVATDRGTHAPGEAVAVTAAVRNTGLLAGTFRAAVRVEDAAGALVRDLGNLGPAAVAPGAQVDLPAVWQTGATLTGSYRIHALLLDEAGAVIGEDRVDVAVRRPGTAGAAAALRLTADRAVYGPGDTVRLAALARNLTGNTLLSDALLQLSAVAPDGAVAFRSTVSLPPLAPGAVHALSVDMPASAPAVYQVSAQLQRPGGGTIAAASTRVTVRAGPGAGLEAAVSVDRGALYQGDTQVCTASVAGRGTLPADAVLQAALIDMAGGRILQTHDQRLTVAPDAPAVAVQALATAGLPPGEYACAWSVAAAGGRLPLGHAVFALLEPPIRIDAAIGRGDKRRMLVLLDGQDGPEPGDAGVPHEGDGTGVRDYVAALLDTLGWRHTIVCSTSRFLAELRGGTYGAYALLGRAALPPEAQRELREAVYRGGALLAAGAGMRLHQLSPALGILPRGRGRPTSLAIAASPLADQARVVPLAGGQPAVAVRPAGAAVAARYLPMVHGAGSGTRLGDDNGLAAVTYFDFGLGRSVYAGIDLAGAAAAAAGGPLGRLLAAALQWTAQRPLPAVAGSVLPLTVTLQNRGRPVDGGVALTLPPGATMVDPEPPPSGGAALWRFRLGAGGSHSLDAWIRLPGAAGTITVSADLSTGTPADSTFYGRKNLELSVAPIPTLADAAAAVSAYGGDEARGAGGAGALIRAARRAMEAEAWQRALVMLVGAADAVQRMPDAAVVTARLAVDYALRDVARRLPARPPASDADDRGEQR